MKNDFIYPWLEKMFHFTSINLTIEDGVKHEVKHRFRDGVKILKIFSVSATPKTLSRKIREAMQQHHRLAECAVLDKDGEEIEHYHLESQNGDMLASLRPDPEMDENDKIYLVREIGNDLKKAMFFVLYNFAEHETIIVYEIVFA